MLWFGLILMALPSPVADFPDMSGTISAAQARATGIMNSVWAQGAQMSAQAQQGRQQQELAKMQAAQAAQAAARPAGYQHISLYGQEPADSNGGSPIGPTTGWVPQGGAGIEGAASALGPGADLKSINTFGKNPDVRQLLAQTLQGEAGGEGFNGMLAVGSVINNRTKSGKYGGQGLEQVIMAPGQFSMWNGKTGYAKGAGALDVDKLKVSPAAYQVADTILSGNYEDPTRGATHYYNPNVATPKWGKAAGGSWQIIGNHVFGFADGRRGAHPPKAGV